MSDTNTLIETPVTGALTEYRAADISSVDFAKRIVTIIAVPYEQEAIVEYRGEIWRESFERGAFNGIEKRPNRVRANRGHDTNRTFGKALRFWPDHDEGLLTEIRVAQTPLGDETLALADEDMLSASVAFQLKNPGDQRLDRSEQRRRIRKAYVRHIGFVEDPAYENSRVVDVRDATGMINAATAPKLITPNLDEVLGWMSARRASS